MAQISTATARSAHRPPRSPGAGSRRPGTAHVAGDPTDVATVRALWCALHPDEPMTPIVDEIVRVAAGRPEVIRAAMLRILSGRLERSAWVNGPALAVLEMALADLVTASGSGEV